MESLVCVASQYSGDMEQARVMMGFPLGGRNITLRGSLWYRHPKFKEWGLRLPTMAYILVTYLFTQTC